MPKPVLSMTVQEAHKEYNSLTDQIWVEYKQLDSGKYGSVVQGLFVLFAHVGSGDPVRVLRLFHNKYTGYN